MRAAWPSRAPAALLLALALALAAGRSAGAADDTRTTAPPSEAERLLFMQPHLANIEPPRTLRYRYHEEEKGQARDDEVTMQFERGATGCCHVHGSYLSGARAIALPDIEQASANPVLLYFLEQQVRQLQQRSGGNGAHFRRRIRASLVDQARLGTATVRWGGRELQARTVRVTPFVDDPYRARFERDADTEYSFVLSDAVPGGVYQMRAVRSGAEPASQTLTLAEPAERPTDKR